MTFVVEFEKCWRIRMVFFQMQVVNFWLSRRVSAVFANIHLKNNIFSKNVSKVIIETTSSPFFFCLPWIFVVCSHIDVQLHGPLDNGSPTNTVVWKIFHIDCIYTAGHLTQGKMNKVNKFSFYILHTCVSPCVSFQVKGIIESFSTKCTKVTLYITVTFHVSIQKALKCKSLLADTTLKFWGIFIAPGRGKLVRFWSYWGVEGQRIFDAMSTIYQLKRSVRWNSELK